MESAELLDRGLLDLSVELSTRDIMAGNDFTLFVLIKNPFAKPVYIRRVHVSLPSELRLAAPENENIKKTLAKKEEFERENKKQQKELSRKIEQLSLQLSNWSKKIKGDKDSNGNANIQVLEDEILELRRDLKTFKQEGLILKVDGDESGASYGNFKIGANTAQISFSSDKGGLSVGNVEVLEPWLLQEERAQARQVELESSLPRDTALQPGNTVVYSVILNVRKSLLFSPSKYRLQFNANYSFNSPLQRKKEEAELKEDGLFTNTIAYELSIRSSIYSVITGSAAGGLIGGAARILQVATPSFNQIFTMSNLIAMVVAVILSMVAIVFMARKSDAQSFVSVEDFWGGLLVGFLVGYTGTSFFENLTGIEAPK